MRTHALVGQPRSRLGREVFGAGLLSLLSGLCTNAQRGGGWTSDRIPVWDESCLKSPFVVSLMTTGPGASGFSARTTIRPRPPNVSGCSD